MATTIDKTLTILGVKDFLGDALKNACKGLDLADVKSNKFNKSVDDALKKANKGADSFNKKTKSFSKNFDDFTSEIPILGNALDKINNPIKIAGAGMVGIATGIGLATREAAKFNAEFRSVRNLNQDKSFQQLEDYRNLLKKTALDGGKSLADITKGFFDVQSGTGKFGNEVAEINSKISKFSTATQSNFTEQINSSIKAINAFNIKGKDLDTFLQSNAKTVQTGIVTYQELARVQADFFGVAAASGQGFDSANKLFAVFTKRTKSAEEAATLTKSAFADLFKPSTLESFSKLGIKVFDKQTGKAKQLDEIVGQLNKKFKPFKGNDAALRKLQSEFSGSEGLIALIGETATNGDKLLETFRQFDQTNFSINDAFKEARKDAFVLQDIIKNKTSVILADIGERTLPIALDVLNKIEAKLPQIGASAERWLKASVKTAEQLAGIVNTVSKPFRSLSNKNSNFNFLRDIGLANEGLSGQFGGNELGITTKQFLTIRNESTKARELFNQEKFAKGFDELVRVLEKAGIQNNKDGKGAELISQFKLKSIDFGLDKLNKKLEKVNKSNASIKPNTSNSLITPTVPTTTSTTPPNTATVNADFFGSGGTGKVRNVNLTINSLVGEVKVNMDTDGMAPEEFQDQMQEWLVGVTRNSEVVLAAE